MRQRMCQANTQKAKTKKILPSAEEKMDRYFIAGLIKDKSLIADCYLGQDICRSRKSLCAPQESGKPGTVYNLTAGGLLISAEDLARVFTVLLNDGQYQGEQYLSQKAIEEMLSGQFEPKKRTSRSASDCANAKNWSATARCIFTTASLTAFIR